MKKLILSNLFCGRKIVQSLEPSCGGGGVCWGWGGGGGEGLVEGDITTYICHRTDVRAEKLHFQRCQVYGKRTFF